MQHNQMASSSPNSPQADKASEDSRDGILPPISEKHDVKGEEDHEVTEKSWGGFFVRQTALLMP
jgi:hypothetical protein